MTQVSPEKIKIEISSDLYRDLENKLHGTSFTSVDELVNYVLRIAINKQATGTELSEEDTQSVTARLKKLGYI
jgi:hypothetical protein